MAKVRLTRLSTSPPKFAHSRLRDAGAGGSVRSSRRTARCPRRPSRPATCPPVPARISAAPHSLGRLLQSAFIVPYRIDQLLCAHPHTRMAPITVCTPALLHHPALGSPFPASAHPQTPRLLPVSACRRASRCAPRIVRIRTVRLRRSPPALSPPFPQALAFVRMSFLECHHPHPRPRAPRSRPFLPRAAAPTPLPSHCTHRTRRPLRTHRPPPTLSSPSPQVPALLSASPLELHLLLLRHRARVRASSSCAAALAPRPLRRLHRRARRLLPRLVRAPFRRRARVPQPAPLARPSAPAPRLLALRSPHPIH